ncbi:ANTAR domain-containing protein [Streptomyces sp. Wh19]|uniref:ANTAR domain-containing protein n=1 Tax=Streptomyces sanglieri TaxID=193460 RepID=A0ABW2X7E0_9ACTN|nr:ANTAR domain-containing protein [Streptomyces sp. Wh19]MDV9201803.1 ANTAR domain-containing protein [Streptomyces sp. Wh19]
MSSLSSNLPPRSPAARGQGSGFQRRVRVRQPERALASHAVIDRACGVLIAWSRCSPEEAWAILVRISQHSNTQARLVAHPAPRQGRGR